MDILIQPSQPSTFEIARNYTVAFDSINLINTLLAKTTKSAEDITALSANAAHLSQLLEKIYWTNEDLTPLQVAVDAAKNWLALRLAPVPDLPTTEQIIPSLTAAVQTHLDTMARTRNYDGILSACSYATDTHQPFQAEGQAAINWRGAVWAACYQIMKDVQAGSRPLPTAPELIALLPAMVWPA